MEKKKRITYIIWFTVCTIISIIFIVPLYYTFVNSLRSIYSLPSIALTQKPDWINYKYAVTLIPFLRYLKNSCIVVSITVFFGVTVDFFYGFAFAKLKVKGNKFLFMLTEKIINEFFL